MEKRIINFSSTIPIDKIKKGTEILQVESINGIRIFNGVFQYWVHWLNFDENGNTWEPIENLLSCHAQIQEFHMQCHGQMQLFDSPKHTTAEMNGLAYNDNDTIIQKPKNIPGTMHFDTTTTESKTSPFSSSGYNHKEPLNVKEQIGGKRSYDEDISGSLHLQKRRSTKPEFSEHVLPKINGKPELKPDLEVFARHGKKAYYYPAHIVSIGIDEITLQWTEDGTITKMPFSNVILASDILKPNIEIYLSIRGNKYYDQGRIMEKDGTDTWTVEAIHPNNYIRNVPFTEMMIKRKEIQQFLNQKSQST